MRKYHSDNTMATKNRTAHITWIIQTIRIPRVKNSKQNCLEQEFQKRVGVGEGEHD